MLDTLDAPSMPGATPVEQMDDDEFEHVCRRMVDHARNHMDDEVLPSVDRAWAYYHGAVDQEPMGFIGNDAHGNPVWEGSKVVVTECRDTMQSLIPDLVRVFQGSDQIVIFQPSGAEDVEQAEQATEYVSWVFWSQPDAEGFLKDALLDWGVKYCAVRVWWEPKEERSTHHLEGLDEQTIHALSQDEEVHEINGTPDPRTFVGPDGSLQQVMLYDVDILRVQRHGKCCIQLIPHEELLYDGDAQHIGESTIIGVDAMRRVSDVVALGIPLEEVRKHASKTAVRRERSDETRRTRDDVPSTVHNWDSYGSDLSTAWVRVVDVKVMVDRDGDGIAEAWRVLMLGDQPELVRSEPDPGSDDIIIGSPYPIPHKVIGQGIVETMTDIQDQSTALVRRIYDNLNRSIQPRMVINTTDSKVVDQALEWFGGPIIVGPNDKVDWLEVPFVAAQAFEMINFIGERRTLRTGISPASQGLDPNALKGQTTDGAQAIVAAPQSRVDGFARQFACVMRDIFRSLLRLSVSYQDKPTVMRLRNKWVPVDPRAWNADMDAVPEVGLGTGTKLERMAGLNWVAMKQEQLLAASSPLVDLAKYHQTLSDQTNVIGIRDPDRYWNDIGPEQLPQIEAQKEQAKQKALQDQVQAATAIEGAKVAPHAQLKSQEAQARLTHEAAKTQLETQHDAQKTVLAAHLDAAKLVTQHQQASDKASAQLVAKMQQQADAHEQKIREMNIGFTTKMTELRAEMMLEMAQMAVGSPAGNGNINTEDHAIASAAVVTAHRARTEQAVEKLANQMQAMTENHQAMLAALSRPRTIMRNEAGDIVGVQ